MFFDLESTIIKKKPMEISIKVTEQEILENPNDFDLGGLIRKKYWDIKNRKSSRHVDDEHFFLDIAEDGTVKRILRPWTCSICGESTEEVDYDYLIGYDHLQCRLKQEMNVEYDTCVICGKTSPYTRSTHIDQRIGYVEGGGQGCFQPNQCDKV